MVSSIDTITAIATPPGKGGVGIIRVSGPNALSIAKAVTGKTPSPRYADYVSFKDSQGCVLDKGLVLYFKAPNSFTGEDVVEFQGHGGPVILDCLLQRVLSLGARMANAGEFSERAFLNDKIDLAQAEAIADLIDANSTQAARLAMRSLQGEFSSQVHAIVHQLTQLRIFVEAAIDFPEEEIDFLSDGKVEQQLTTIIQSLVELQARSKQGAIIREGLQVVIAGEPNAGKSTLINQLSGEDVAIVTDIAGTTRDVMRQSILIDNIPLHLIDTAGLRESSDLVEREGIKRAWLEIEKADCVLLLVDVNNIDSLPVQLGKITSQISQKIPLQVIINKVDTCETAYKPPEGAIAISAKSGEGVSQLKQAIKQIAGFEAELAEGSHLARRRHLDCLEKSLDILHAGQKQLVEHKAGELLAEDLRQAQIILGDITGAVSADELLGHIFSSFCIGK